MTKEAVQMNINPNLADPNQIPYGVQSALTSQKWSKRDWLVKVYIPIIVPIIGALIGGGYFFLKPSSSSIPALHSSYTGTYFDVTYGTQGPLTLSDVSENTTTGAFTSAGTIGTAQGTCTYQVTQGVVSADGKMTSVVNYQSSSACGSSSGTTADLTAQLNSAGDITGTWKNVSIQDTGNFTLS